MTQHDLLVLGLWMGTGGKGASFWLQVLTEIKNRGTDDVCIVVCDGVAGLPDATTTTWPLAATQTCVLYLIEPPWDVQGDSLPAFPATPESACVQLLPGRYDDQQRSPFTSARFSSTSRRTLRHPDNEHEGRVSVIRRARRNRAALGASTRHRLASQPRQRPTRTRQRPTRMSTTTWRG